MGRVFALKLEGGRIYSCKYCQTHLAHHDHVVSRAFQGRTGKAYLFSTVVNLTFGPHEERMMLSGLHTVADIFCISCGQILGWKYEVTPDETQKYKEGKYVVERARIVVTSADPDVLSDSSDDDEDSDTPA